MNLAAARLLAVFDNFAEKPSGVLADTCRLVAVEKPVTIKFYKYPIRPPFDRNVRRNPAIEPRHIHRLIMDQRTVLDSRHRQTSYPPRPVKNQRSCKYKWQLGLFSINFHIFTARVRSILIERQAAFVDLVDHRHLRLFGRGRQASYPRNSRCPAESAFLHRRRNFFRRRNLPSARLP